MKSENPWAVSKLMGKELRIHVYKKAENSAITSVRSETSKRADVWRSNPCVKLKITNKDQKVTKVPSGVLCRAIKQAKEVLFS